MAQSEYFWHENNYLICKKPYTEVYILNDDIKDTENVIAYSYADYYKVLGLFNMRFFDDDEGKIDRSKVPLRVFNYPVTITTYPDDTSVETLDILGTPMKYRVLKYNQGSRFMSTDIKQDASDAETFLNLLVGGRFPKGIPYDNILSLMIECFLITGVDPGVPALIPQLIISTMCRAENDISKEFRFIAGKSGKVDMTSYRVRNVNQVTAASSVLQALSFERYNDKMVASLLMSYNNTEQTETPLSKIVTLQGLLD